MAYHNNQMCLDAIQQHGISLPCTCYCSCSCLDCAIYHCCSFACEHAQILMKMVIVIFILTAAVTTAPHGRSVLGMFNCNESFKSIDTEICASEVLNRTTDCMCERASVRVKAVAFRCDSLWSANYKVHLAVRTFLFPQIQFLLVFFPLWSVFMNKVIRDWKI